MQVRRRNNTAQIIKPVFFLKPPVLIIAPVVFWKIFVMLKKLTVRTMAKSILKN